MNYSEEIIKLKKICEEYNIDCVGDTINYIEEIERQSLEKIVFWVSTRVSSLASGYTTVRNSMMDGYEGKEKLIELYKEIASFFRIKNENGYDVIADSFDKIKNNIGLQSARKLTEQLRNAIKLYDALEEIKRYEKKYNVYSSFVKCIQSCIKSITFANDNPDMFENDKLLKLNEVREKIFAFIQKAEMIGLNLEDKITLDSDLIKRLEEFDLTSLETYLDQYDHIATDIWKGYLNNPNTGNKGLHYLVHSGLIYGKYNKNTISTSLLTEKHMITAGGNYNSGMIIVPHDIVGAESDDIGSNNYSTAGVSLHLEGGRNIIKLPQLVEAETIKYVRYSEVNSRDFEIVGVYSIINAEGKSHTRYYKDGKKLAQKMRIPFVEIDQRNRTQIIILPEQKKETIELLSEVGRKFVQKIKRIFVNSAEIESVLLEGSNNDSPSLSSEEGIGGDNSEEIEQKTMTLAEEIATSGRGYNNVRGSAYNGIKLSKKIRDSSLDR